MIALRPFRPGDEDGVAAVCLRTADAGADATGVLEDDGLWALVFALPYGARHPDLAFVVADDDDRVIGYVVATDDTDAFEAWFRDVWWPTVRAERPRAAAAGPRQERLLAYADARGPGVEPYARTYPAHLHIDLLPEAQGQGWGRALIARLLDTLRSRGVTGLHLVASAENAGAAAFYTRLGFTPLPGPPDARAFAIDLTRPAA